MALQESTYWQSSQGVTHKIPLAEEAGEKEDKSKSSLAKPPITLQTRFHVILKFLDSKPKKCWLLFF
jgi:hypothetical protein